MRHLDRATKKVNTFVLLLEHFPSFTSQLEAGNVSCQLHLGAINKDRSVWEPLRGSDVMILRFVKHLLRFGAGTHIKSNQMAL